MRTIDKLSLACLASLALLPTASISDESFLPYIEWLTANSDFEYNGEPLPTVEYHTQAMLQIMAYGDQVVARAEYEGRKLNVIEGVYDDNVIYLQKGIDTPPYVIVHELVHYLQDVNGVTDDCIPANEPIAYRLHHQWAKDNGYNLPSGNLFMGILMGMACEDQYGFPH